MDLGKREEEIGGEVAVSEAINEFLKVWLYSSLSLINHATRGNNLAYNNRYYHSL